MCAIGFRTDTDDNLRTLIYSGCTVNSELKCDMTALWSKVIMAINPTCDVMLFDTASDIDPATFIQPGITIEYFKDNPGHLAHGGGDGAGRTFCAGFERAVMLGYDYVVMCETDMFFIRPVEQVVARMAKAGVKAACLQMPFYQFFEFAFSAFNVKWVKDTQLVERYNWRTAPMTPIPEQRVEWLCGDDLFVLPYHGIRNSMHWATAENLTGLFPYKPPDWLHDNAAKDLSVVKAFLRVNGIEA